MGRRKGVARFDKVVGDRTLLPDVIIKDQTGVRGVRSRSLPITSLDVSASAIEGMAALAPAKKTGDVVFLKASGSELLVLLEEQ